MKKRLYILLGLLVSGLQYLTFAQSTPQQSITCKFGSPQITLKAGQLKVATWGGTYLFGCIPNQLDPSSTNGQYVALDEHAQNVAEAPTENGKIKYTPTHGSVIRLENQNRPLRNRNFTPLGFPNNPHSHKVGKIIYYLNHYWEGVEGNKWHLLDNAIIFEVYPEVLTLDYNAGSTTINVYSNGSWTSSGLSIAGESLTPSSSSVNGHTPVTYNYPENNTDRISNRTIYFKRENLNLTRTVKVVQNYKPKYLYSNILDVYGKEQSGTVPEEYKGKVNPGPERFFAWVTSPTKFRMRIKYNGGPIGSYTHPDPVLGDYDYEYDGKGDIIAYEYQLKENLTNADRKIDLEISFQKANGDWEPWEDVGLKNSNNTAVTQSHLQHKARRRWSKKYIGATEDAKDVSYVYQRLDHYKSLPSSYYKEQAGTWTTGLKNDNPLVTGYTEAGVGSGWKVPDEEDLKDLKIAGFIPNRPFLYTYDSPTRIPAADTKYNNWAINSSNTVLLDSEVFSKQKYGYGNAFYLYDKTGSMVWFPINGRIEYYRQSFFNLTEYSIDHKINLLGTHISNSSSTTETTDYYRYADYVTCYRNGQSEPQHYLKYSVDTRNLGNKFKLGIISTQNGVDIKDDQYISSYSLTESYGESRECTVTSSCYHNGPVFGPAPPAIQCGRWKDFYDYYSFTKNYQYTYRLTHD
ncbi:BACON domain-containing protein [Bergeyella cardium]|uniref:Uncharacterized protein n=1 Tax=Bergeyella cardium TaxID=1585976 RepID=A0A6P1QS35_9FLAO|nr:BACON domain-containing protein [Bergeyella cardium]QHN64912.1 hypothetical protein DBX24_02875 [Bergeyella cardium]WHE34222.1 BACON domain-containing protein [Bergeyella cardium]WHF60873.1 BACON domain-containing protein [Bergeyella cardium]